MVVIPLAWLPFIASASAGGVAGIAIVNSILLPLAFGINLINIIVCLIYLIKQHPQGWAKVISYIFLIYFGYTALQEILLLFKHR